MTMSIPRTTKKTVWYLPIEYIETRYSAEWFFYIQSLLARYASMCTTRDVYEGSISIEHVQDKLPSKKKTRGAYEYAVIRVDGLDLKAPNTNGAFINFGTTNYWKSTQLAAFAECISEGHVKNGDVIYVTDAWNPAILQIRYMLDLLGIKAEIHAQWHAGYHDKEDQLYKRIQQRERQQSCTGMRNTEAALFDAIDKNYFTTEFYLDMFEENTSAIVKSTSNGNVVRCGYPMSYTHDLPYAQSAVSQALLTTEFPANGKEEDKDVLFDVVRLYGDFDSPVYNCIHWYNRQEGLAYKDLILFPHRKADEKMPELFDELRGASIFDPRAVKNKRWVSVHDFEQPLKKREYYNLLAASRVVVSFAKQETYGISMVEAVMAGAIPVVPDRLSYAEMYIPAFKYSSYKTFCDLGAGEPNFNYLLETIEYEYLHACDSGYKDRLKEQKEKLVNEFFGDMTICKSIIGR